MTSRDTIANASRWLKSIGWLLHECASGPDEIDSDILETISDAAYLMAQEVDSALAELNEGTRGAD